MPVLIDDEFGKITIRRSAVATQIKVRVAPDGTLHASLPMRAPLFLVKHMLKTSKLQLRRLIGQSKPEYIYENGMQIGKSHSLIIQPTANQQFSINRHGQQIIVKLPAGSQIDDIDINRKVRDAVISALRLEAKSYLPKRLSFLAEKYGFTYNQTRFSHSSGRWGSCSSNGTISLNIALMKLPFELIDYVIIHELSHTKQMNHGQEFWDLVKIGDSKYIIHRKLLKLQNPTI